MKTTFRFFSILIFLLAGNLINANAQTYFSGGIYTNTTWTLANSPYILTDTVVVFPGDTLTIEPGVIVKCDSNVLLEIRQAALIANGTLALPISFQANSLLAGRNFWKGLYLNNFDTSVINYCRVKNASNGVFFKGGVSYYPILKIKNTIFEQNYIALSNSIGIFNNLFGNNFCIIDSCTFSNNNQGYFNSTYNGISSSLSKIMNSLFDNNKNFAIQFRAPFEIKNCVIKNGIIGVDDQSYSNYLIYTTISNSRISQNQKGVNSINKSPTLLVNNSIIDSNNIGINLQEFDALVVKNCIIKSNINGIIYKTNKAYSHLNISNNTILNNNIGISGEFSLDSIYCNKIFNDTLYDFKYLGINNNSHIGSNDWGTTNTSSIDAKFYDGYDNVSLGLVNYLPIDTSQCYLSSCNLVLTPLVTNASCDTCKNGAISVVASNGGAPYHFTWYTSPLQTTSSINHISSGNYTYCVTDVRGCAKCDTVFVDSINCNLFKATATILNASCSSCNDGGAHITTVNGNAPYTYAWTSSPLQTTDSLKNMTWGTYAGCVADSKGCISCDTIFIDSSRCNHLAIQLFSNGVSCKICADGSAWVKVNGGNAPFNYHWNTFPVLLIDSIFSRPFGMHSVCVTDAMNCQSCDSVFVDSINCNGFTATFNKMNVSCNTCNDGKAWIVANGGIQPYSYSWSNGNNNDTIFNLHQNIYTACITDNIGCSICNSVMIDSINCSGFHVLANGTNTTCGSCANGKAWATAIGGGAPYNYSWNTSPLSTTDTIKNILVGSYIVTVTDAYSCMAKDTITIDSTLCFRFQALVSQTNPSCATCNNGAVSLTLGGGKLPYHYTWYTSPMSNTSSVSGLTSGLYSYCVNDANNCAICDTIDLTQFCSAHFNLSPDTATPHHYFATNLASGISPIQYSWSWGDGSPNDTGALPTHTYSTPGFYTICLNIIDANGCTNNYCDSFYLMRSKNPMVVITVIKKPAEPNGLLNVVESNSIKIFPNPIHNYLNIEMPLSIKQATLSIYSLLGQLVYKDEISNTENKIDVSKLNNGIYILQLSNQDILIRKKIYKE